MEIVWAIFGLLFVLLIHEFGHAVRMLKCGVEVEEIGLGFPIPGLPRLRIPLGQDRPAFCIHPFLVGAYVKPSKAGEEEMKGLWKESQAYILRGGIVYNYASGILFMFAGLILHAIAAAGQPKPATPPSSLEWTWQTTFIVLGVVGGIALAVLCWLRARWVFGVLLLGLAGYVSIIRTGNSYMSIGGILEQLIGMARSPHSMLTGMGSISISMAALNYLPVPPMDGWRLAKLSEPVREKEREMRLGSLEIALLLGLLLATVYGFVHDLVLFAARIIVG